MRKIAVSIGVLLFLTIPIFAQTAAGGASISGVVKDPSGAVVPNAKVVISSEGQGIIRVIATNDAGAFTAPALIPSPGYKVAVNASGFAPYEAANLELQVGQNLDLHISLAVGTSATHVEVSTTAPLVEDTKSDFSGVVDTRAIQDLPINGRRVDSFVLLEPGVHNDGTYGLLSFRGTAGQNSFLVDGTDTTEQFYNENAGRTRIAAQISQDAVQEFQVVSSNYSAEYGRAMGGIVNTVTKSGTNDLHASAFWFYRSSAFIARDPFSTYAPSEVRQQAGGTVGGAIKKDKLFYFLSTEITHRNFPLISSLNTTAVNPTTETWKSCGVASGSQPAASAAQCAAINALLPRYFTSIPRTLDQQLYFARLDYHASDQHTFSASFNFLHDLSPNGIQTGTSVTTGGAISGNGDDAVTVRNGRAVWTWVPASNFVNEFHVGFASDRQGDTFDQAELGGGLGYLQVSVNGTQLGPAAYLPRIEPSEDRWQFQDNATYNAGRHTIKFGVDAASTYDYVFYISSYFGGYTYQTVNAFALDYSGAVAGAKNWQTYAQTFGNPAVAYTIKDTGVYLEDQWRATDRLTINAGLRYEHAALPQPKSCNQNFPLTCQLSSTPDNLAPRLGLAYRLNDKTVLQAGYGMFHARFQGGTIDNLFTSGNGVYQTSLSLAATQAPQLAAGPVFPNVLATQPTVGNISAASLQYMEPGVKTPYAEQGNVGVQRQLISGLALDVSYLWTRGVQLPGVRDMNLPILGSQTMTYTIDNASGASVGSYTTPVYIGARPNTAFGGIYQDENGVNSYFNALAVQLNKRFSKSFQGQLSYTWSHEIDDGQSYGESTNNLFMSSASYWTINGDYKYDKSSGNLDQRQRLVFSWSWTPTFVHSEGAFFKYVVNNWELSNITTFATGNPYSVSVKVTDTPVTGMFSNSNLAGSGLASVVPFAPYYSNYYPTRYNSDARLSKIVPIAERMKLFLNFEVFNLTNSWAATSISSTQAFTEAKGVLTPTPLGSASADAGFPDGTQARRLQISARLQF
jgi:outer membrane receptor protein involved in Fe transport